MIFGTKWNSLEFAARICLSPAVGADFSSECAVVVEQGGFESQ